MARARRLTEGPLREVRGRAGREGTRALTVIQENPVIAVGAAFALGFLLAGRSDPTRGFGKKKQQLRGAIVGAAAAALTQEARDLLEREGGIAGLLGGLFGADPPLDEEDEEGFTEGAEDDDPLDYYASEEEEDEEYDPDHQL